MRGLVAAALFSLSTLPAAAIEFQLPIDCTPGATCAVQHYVDRDPGPEAVDYRCGHQTYDGHDGIDIRVPTLRAMASGVAVVAAADGVVTALRDGMADISVNDADPASIAGRECGNGVVIDHGDGWVSQYCHMKEGSIDVSVGDHVATGAPLGAVGLSGDTEFPHLHFTVRKDNETVDPFAVEPLAGAVACAFAGNDRTGLWSPEARQALVYRPAFVLNAGFSNAAVTEDQVASGTLEDIRLKPDSPALVFYGRAIGLEAGDVQRLTVTGPDGEVFAANELEPLDRPNDQYFAFIGKKRRKAPWPAGAYHGRYSVIRNGKEIATGEAAITITD